MANLFLGFPVPRAKIADMIAGTAPPSLHKTQHEDGGTDEMDCTGLVGAGGISLPFDDFFWRTLFESIDYFSQSLNGGGSIYIDADNLSAKCAGTSGDRGQIYKILALSYVPLTWAKDREFRVQAGFYAVTNSTQRLEIGVGSIWTGYGFGFAVIDGVLVGRCRSPAGNNDINIVDWGASGYDQQVKLRAKLTAGEKVEFWVDDVLEATESTYFPTGTTSADRVFQATANNPVAGNSGEVWLSEWQFWQEV